MIRMLDSVKSCGIKFIRDECYWSEVEKVRGIYEYPKEVDNYVRAARERGIGILMLLDYNNPLYAAHAGAGISTDSNRIAFTKYCVETVKRYSALGVIHYEIWNEPNIPTFWDPSPNSYDYYKVLEAVYPAIKSIDTNTILLGCATSPAEGNPSPFIPGKEFIKQVYDLGGGKYMDGISFHFYTVDKPVENWYSANISAIKYIVKDKPLYLTETGYPTSTVWPNVSFNSQALYLSRLYLLGRRDLQMLSWYDLKNDGENSAENEHNFGLLNYNLSQKPSFTAYKNVIEQTSGKQLDSIAVSNNNYHYIFRNSSTETHAIWNPSQPSRVTGSFPKGALEIVYALGRKEYIYDHDGIITILYKPEPAFVSTVDTLPDLSELELINPADSLMPGQSMQFEVQAFTKNSEPITIDAAAAEWSFSNDCAYFDAPGHLVTKSPGKGILRVKFIDKEAVREIEILPFFESITLDSFNSTAGFNISLLELLPSSAVTVTDTSSAESGKSFLINYSFQYRSKTLHRIVFEKDFQLLGEPDSLFIDVYNNGNGHVLNFQFQDADGETFGISTKGEILAGRHGWNTLSVPLSNFGEKFNYPAELKKLTLYTIRQNAKSDSVYSGKILIDNLQAHYKPLTNAVSNEGVINDFVLFQNYPNPFNPVTSIRFVLSSGGYTSLTVYNLIGQKAAVLADCYMDAGAHVIEWNAQNLSSGIYLYELKSGDKRTARKMQLLK